MIDDDDGAVDLKARPWSWWNLGSTFFAWLAQMFIHTGNALQEVDEHMAQHAIWLSERRDFAESVAKFIETIPVTEDNERG